MITNRSLAVTLAVLLTAAVSSSPSPVAAADVGGPPPFHIPSLPSALAPAASWQGFYLGAHGGVTVDRWSGLGATYEETGNFEFAGTRKDLDVGTTSAFGLNGGHLAQFGPLVLGGELSATVGAFEADLAENPPPGNDYVTKAALGPILAAKARAGLAYDRFLAYGTAGYAWSNVDFDASFVSGVDPVTGAPVRTSIKNSFDVEGLVYGGGLEIALSKTVSFGVEYLRYDFGDSAVAVLPVTSSGITTEKVRADASLDTIQARLNFRF